MFRSKLICCSVLLLCLLSLPSNLCAYTVLWDTSHGVANTSYVPHLISSSRYYYNFTGILDDSNFTIETSSAGFSDIALSGKDVAVINGYCAVSSSYGIDEMDALKQFVADGGGLLIMAEPGSYTRYANIASQFGVTFDSTVSDFDITTDDLADHPVFDGVSDIDMYYAMGLSVSDSARAIAYAPDGEVLAASAVYGDGRVIVLGDSTLWLYHESTTGINFDNLAQVDNEQLAVSVFEHLVDTTYVPEPATMLLMLGGAILLKRKR